MEPLKRALAYSVSDPRLPYKRNSWYRFERMGLIELKRVGGKTLLTDEVLQAIMSGRIPLPDHPSRLNRPEPKVRRKGRSPTPTMR